MRRLISYICLITVIFVLLIFITERCSSEYLVKLTFCDNRESVTIKVKALSEPMSSDINSYKEAVPKYKGYYNVCDIKTVLKLN